MAIYTLVTDKLLRCLKQAVKDIECSLGHPRGIATLDDTGNVPADQLGNATGSGAIVEIKGLVKNGGTFVDGQSTYTNVLVGDASVVWLFRNRLKEPEGDPGDGSSYYTVSGNTITFVSALSNNELIDISLFI